MNFSITWGGLLENLQLVEVEVLSKKKDKTWLRRLDEAKKKHRPKLRDWGKDGFATFRNVDYTAYAASIPIE